MDYPRFAPWTESLLLAIAVWITSDFWGNVASLYRVKNKQTLSKTDILNLQRIVFLLERAQRMTATFLVILFLHKVGPAASPKLIAVSATGPLMDALATAAQWRGVCHQGRPKTEGVPLEEESTDGSVVDDIEIGVASDSSSRGGKEAGQKGSEGVDASGLDEATSSTKPMEECEHRPAVSYVSSSAEGEEILVEGGRADYEATACLLHNLGVHGSNCSMLAGSGYLDANLAVGPQRVIADNGGWPSASDS